MPCSVCWQRRINGERSILHRGLLTRAGGSLAGALAHIENGWQIATFQKRPEQLFTEAAVSARQPNQMVNDGFRTELLKVKIHHSRSILSITNHYI